MEVKLVSMTQDPIKLVADIASICHGKDEVIVEVERPEQLDDVLEIMARPLSWAPGLPLKGAGFVCDYYQKD